MLILRDFVIAACVASTCFIIPVGFQMFNLSSTYNTRSRSRLRFGASSIYGDRTERTVTLTQHAVIS
eukprot:scaffold616796_cov52-Prasinocladus_malaysianus.AAC.1